MKGTERWVVFETPVHVKGRRLTVICEQEEWDTMEPDLRKNYVLIRAAIANEGEAERLARSSSTLALKENRKRSA
jgi:hypothetical protein